MIRAAPLRNAAERTNEVISGGRFDSREECSWPDQWIEAIEVELEETQIHEECLFGNERGISWLMTRDADSGMLWVVPDGGQWMPRLLIDKDELLPSKPSSFRLGHLRLALAFVEWPDESFAFSLAAYQGFELPRRLSIESLNDEIGRRLRRQLYIQASRIEGSPTDLRRLIEWTFCFRCYHIVV